MYNPSEEEIFVKETIDWLLDNNEKQYNINMESLMNWAKFGQKLTRIDDQTLFCDADYLQNLVSSKNLFNNCDMIRLRGARSRCNPFEAENHNLFMNRDGIKMANIDCVTNFMFTQIDKNIYFYKKNISTPIYFADVCAGPGGFTEYILWRRKWFFKGFGFTLKEFNNCNLYFSKCVPPLCFQFFYGAENDGDVRKLKNVYDFRMKILRETNGAGVHFMVSDGGFSVKGNENIQEVLTKSMYTSQMLVCLEIVREHGCFLTKLFDTFTPFTVGLIYLMYKCFEKVSILKPNSSRPANSERYLVCYNLKDKSSIVFIKKYLRYIVNHLWENRDNAKMDINEIIPLEILLNDKNFFSYIYKKNNTICKRQIFYLQKLFHYYENTNLVDKHQKKLQVKCFEYWQLSKHSYSPNYNGNIENLLDTIKNKEIFLKPKLIDDIKNLKCTLTDPSKWCFIFTNCTKNANIYTIFASISHSKIFNYKNNSWELIKNLHLVPGSIVYGEIVQEWDNLEYKTSSLHIIDALRLGNMSLSEMKFQERNNLIKRYCKSINNELSLSSYRIRAKDFHLETECKTLLSKYEQSFILKLPLFGYKRNVVNQFYYINSILFLKIDNDQDFYSTMALKLQYFYKYSKRNQVCDVLELKNVN